MSRFQIGRLGLVPLMFICILISCEDTPVAPIELRGKVTNGSGEAGSVIVEIDYYLSTVADSSGNFRIEVHRDFLVDSLYAWVDTDEDGDWAEEEPFGFFHTRTDTVHAWSFQCRDQDVKNLSFDIPPRPIAVANPARGGQWTRGTSRGVRWDYTNACGDSVKVGLYKGGVYWGLIMLSTADSGSYQWIVADCRLGAVSDCQVKVTDINGNVSDLSGSFTIAVPSNTEEMSSEMCF